MDRSEMIMAAMAAGEDHSFTPVQIQKMMFVIDREIASVIAGEPFFDFKPKDYGPFDKEVYFELHNLEDRSLVRINDSIKPRLYILTEKGLERGEEYLEDLDDHKDYIETLANWIQSKNFKDLVSAIYNTYPDMKKNSVFNVN